jgi:DNA-binding NtrC family response regulator
MDLRTEPETETGSFNPAIGLVPRIPYEGRILIVSDEQPIVQQLDGVFDAAGFTSESTNTIAAASEFVRYSRIQVVFATPSFVDGSWRRLVDISSHYDLHFVVVLMTLTADLDAWTRALDDGAFEVLDASHDLSRAPEVARAALWAAYLNGAPSKSSGKIRPYRAA